MDAEVTRPQGLKASFDTCTGLRYAPMRAQRGYVQYKSVRDLRYALMRAETRQGECVALHTMPGWLWISLEKAR